MKLISVIFWLCLLSYEGYSQVLNGSYRLSENIDDLEEIYKFSYNHRFTFTKRSNHNQYLGEGYYVLGRDSLYLFYKSQNNFKDSYFETLYEPITSPNNQTEILIIVNDFDNQALVPIINCTSENKVVTNSKIAINTSKFVLDNVTESDSLSIIVPGYSSLKISLKNFINKQSALVANLHFIDNTYYIQNKLKIWFIKRMKNGFKLFNGKEFNEYIEHEENNGN